MSYIRPTIKGNTSETGSGKELKILGFWFGEKPTVNLHVQKMCVKFRSRLWSLRKLKNSGLSVTDLVKIYTSVLRPVLEFACVTFGLMLSNDLSNVIERLQLRVFKIIYGLHVSYTTALETSGLKTLKTRRQELLQNFAQKTLQNPKFSHKWFPLAPETNHDTPFPKKFLEEESRTARLYNSPLFTMRRILNESD